MRMERYTRRSILCLTVLVALACPVYGQESPHGDISLECQSCHSTESWKMRSDPTFTHAKTGFELTGSHAAVQCASCHKDLKFARQSRDCSSCHTDVHKGELAANCLKCHTTKSWKVTDMRERHDQTRFVLAGRHRTLDCASCHGRGREYQYAGTPTSCIGCHRDDFLATENPDHATSGFSVECATCHEPTAFRWEGSFDHAATRFPLTGAHVATSCISCHVNQQFVALPMECVSCHQSDFQNTTNPNHIASLFPTDCQMCHTTTAWQGATFNHAATDFPLTGAHVAASCQTCHGGNYQLVYTDCFQCHQTDYQSATNPNHGTANFSHDCTPCHTTTVWTPSTFNHDQQYFRIYSGAHRNKWTLCSECHQNSSNYSEFSCLGCHEHRQSAMDSEHNGVSGYTYSSPACYSCHRGV